MKTRSQTRSETQALFDVEIDFDYASQVWKSNKKSIGNGSYKYVCYMKNKCCNYKCLPGEFYCKRHINSKAF